jgi:transcriptional regulator with XRE-family HTH domain
MPRSTPRPKRLLHHEPTAVAQARADRGLTKTALARAAGLSHVALTYLESGQTSARPETLARIAAALNCPVELLERRRPLTCECGYGFDPQPNNLVPVHTSRISGDWCARSGDPVSAVERSAA